MKVNKKLEDELQIKIQAEKVILAKKEAELLQREKKVAENLKLIVSKEQGIQAKISDVRRREDRIDADQKEIDRIKSLLAQI